MCAVVERVRVVSCWVTQAPSKVEETFTNLRRASARLPTCLPTHPPSSCLPSCLACPHLHLTLPACLPAMANNQRPTIPQSSINHRSTIAPPPRHHGITQHHHHCPSLYPEPPISPAAAPRTPTPDPTYGSGGGYSAGAGSDIAVGEDASDRGSSQGGAPAERRKSSSLKGMLKKLKA